MPDSALGMIFLIIAIVLLLIFFFTFVPISLWISTIASGVKVVHGLPGGHAVPADQSLPHRAAPDQGPPRRA